MALSLAAVVAFSACSKKDADTSVDNTEKTDTSNQEVVETFAEPIDFAYSVSAGKAKITAYTGTDTEISIPANITDPETGEVYAVATIADGAFFGNDVITSVEIPEGVKTVGIAAFQNCTALTRVVMPSTLEDIGVRAFFNCVALSDVTFGENVSSVGDMAFGDVFVVCPWYESLTDNAVVVGDGVLLKYNGTGKVTFDESVKHVAYNAFLDSKVETATFSPALESIDEKAFTGSSTVAVLCDGCPAVKDANDYGIKYQVYAIETEDTSEVEENAEGEFETETADVTADAE